jgi:hypothetical protein
VRWPRRLAALAAVAVALFLPWSGLPLPYWPGAVAVTVLLSCAAWSLLSASFDAARLLRAAGRHVRRVR